MSIGLPRNIHLRRIQWAVSSPPLMDYSVSINYFRDSDHREETLAMIRQLDDDGDSVNVHFNESAHLPMGKYFEQLLFFLVEKDPRLELMLSNEQIKEGNRTIGEIDLIVKDTLTKQVEHWEVCLKYYLQSLPSTDARLMLGPNAIDNLDRKSNKLLNHQLPLSKHQSLKYITGVKSIEPKLFMKGQFFYHLNEMKTIPKLANQDHETGWWCFLSEAYKMLNRNLSWTTLWKPDWIGTHLVEDGSSLVNAPQLIEALQAHFKSESNSILAVGMKETADGWAEETRGFIVNDNWPHLIPQQG